MLKSTSDDGLYSCRLNNPKLILKPTSAYRLYWCRINNTKVVPTTKVAKWRQTYAHFKY